MPFVPQIRKQILHALEQHILPVLARDEVVQILSQPPFLHPQIHSYYKDIPFLEDLQPGLLQPSYTWKEEQMSAGRSPYLMFIYQGTMQYTIGITRQMAREMAAKNFDVQKGGITLHLPEATCLYQIPMIPGENGRQPFHVNCESVSLLAMNLWDDEILAHVATSSNRGVDCSHSLTFKDRALVQMARLYKTELEDSPPGETSSPQALLYAFFSRMRRLLKTREIPLSNTSWAGEVERQVQGETRMEQLCLEAMRYIEKNLQAGLSWEAIAGALDISPIYLNVIFQETLGTTVMRYVTHRRIEAAKQILAESNEALKDVSQLVGFAGASSFGNAFKRATGLSPQQYRKQYRS